MEAKTKFLLHLADTPLILGQRLGEWCGHGPVLEQDIALTNIALDLIGQARLYFQHIASLAGKSEDEWAMLRREHEYLNPLLVEQPNGNFADTLTRQFFYDAFSLIQYESLQDHSDETIKAIAVKSLKEIKYHHRFSREWMFRLGDGTETSHQYIQTAWNTLWRYTGELFSPASYETELMQEGLAPDVSLFENEWLAVVKETAKGAGIQIPDKVVMQTGGKEGRHTEYMGYILTELQYMQRTYPAMTW